MNQQAESDFIVNQLRVLPKHRNRAIAALAKNDLSNNQRRIWLTVFKRFTLMHRDCLHWAGEALPSAQLVELWREFVKTGLAVCDGQEKLISAKLESHKLTVNQRCGLVTMFARVVKLSRDFEAYKDEMPAAGSPHCCPKLPRPGFQSVRRFISGVKLPASHRSMNARMLAR